MLLFDSLPRISGMDSWLNSSFRAYSSRSRNSRDQAYFRTQILLEISRRSAVCYVPIFVFLQIPTRAWC